MNVPFDRANLHAKLDALASPKETQKAREIPRELAECEKKAAMLFEVVKALEDRLGPILLLRDAPDQPPGSIVYHPPDSAPDSASPVGRTLQGINRSLSIVWQRLTLLEGSVQL